MSKLQIYTDGSAHPNPGPGGYGIVVFRDEELVNAYSEQFEQTTNNQMELLAILNSLKKFGLKGVSLETLPEVYTDSAYSYNTFSLWMFNWKRNGWIKSDKRVPENIKIIKEYYDLWEEGYRINLKLIKGHANILGNEIADRLATGALTVDEVMKRYGGDEALWKTVKFL